ncbi:MAG: NAD-dependent DNA ligase LigA [Candidatus Oxydemutatoraceae bacterium WSBS_2016_MAG_OTU14]
MPEQNALLGFDAKEDKQLKQRLEALYEEIRKHNFAYHTLGRPIISDYEYDVLFKEMCEIELANPKWVKPSSPSQCVGQAPAQAFNKVRHHSPMLSLDNILRDAEDGKELYVFDQRVRRQLHVPEDSCLEYSAEYKFDGIAVSLTYEDGLLKRAATRGNGVEGEDITLNVLTIKEIPYQLKLPADFPHILDVRGEVYMTKQEFKALNTRTKDQKLEAEKHKRLGKEKKQEQITFDNQTPAATKEQQEPLEEAQDSFSGYVNPRNATAGILQQLNPTVTAQCTLKFSCYNAITVSDNNDYFNKVGKHASVLKQMAALGVPTSATKVVQGIEACAKHYEKLEALREGLDYDVDGVVIKLNALDLQRRLGATARSPRWAVAYKFPPEVCTTTIENVVFQIGRTGTLTPVAKVKAVVVGGVTVKNVTLHNMDEVGESRKDIRIGDTVKLQRAGDVIPQIIAVEKEKRSGNERKIVLPSVCPEPGCGGEVKKDNLRAYCSHTWGCPGQRRERIKHFVARKAMDIQGLGDKWIKCLCAEELIQDVSDLYALKMHRTKLIAMENMDEISVDKVFASIEASREISLERFIYALGIHEVGVTMAWGLAKQFKDMQTLRCASKEALEEVENMGAVSAQKIIDFFQDSRNNKMINRLLESIRLLPPQSDSDELHGQVYVLSGGFKSMSRENATEQLRRRGAKIGKEINAETTAFIHGEKPIERKLKAAEKASIPIWNEDDLLKLMGASVPDSGRQ